MKNRQVRFLKITTALLLFILIHFISKSQIINDSFLIDNQIRTFHFIKPTTTQIHSSLIFVLHGSGECGIKIMKDAIMLEQQSQIENFIAVYPDGYKRYWNECRKSATSEANIINIDEGSFFNEMIEYFTEKYQINPKHVFAVGFSGGGHMAYKLGITMPEKIKAITAIVANLPDSTNMDCVESGIALPVMIINGTNDHVNPYYGGEVKVTNVKLGTVRSTEQTFKYWATLAGYNEEPKKELIPDNDKEDGMTIEKYFYKKKNLPEVVLLKVINGVHNYPKDINVFLESWLFFKRQITEN